MVFLRRLGAFIVLVLATALLLAAVRYTYLPGSPGPPFVRYLWLAVVALPAMLGSLMARSWRLRWPGFYGLLAYGIASGLAAGLMEGLGEPPGHVLSILATHTLCPTVTSVGGGAFPATLLNALSFVLVCLLSWGLHRDSEPGRLTSRWAEAGSQGQS